MRLRRGIYSGGNVAKLQDKWSRLIEKSLWVGCGVKMTEKHGLGKRSMWDVKYKVREKFDWGWDMLNK